MSDSSYVVAPWRIEENQLDLNRLPLGETLFSLGNGWLGSRGTWEEGYPQEAPAPLEGTYINGAYLSHKIQYGEKAYGFAENNHVMATLADSKHIQILVDDELLNRAEVISHQRILDMQAGVSQRNTIWKLASGVEIEVQSERLISLNRPELMANKLVIRARKGGCHLSLEAGIRQATTQAELDPDDPRIGEQDKSVAPWYAWGKDKGALWCTQDVEGQRVFQCLNTAISRCDAEHQAWHKDKLVHGFTLALSQGQSVELVQAHRFALIAENETTSANLASGQWDYAALRQEQQQAWATYWHSADMQIEGDQALQQGVRFNSFQLRQSLDANPNTSVAAKGLSGPGYEGHYFWDAEVYALPYFLYTQPEIAKSQLLYRISKLAGAREQARKLGLMQGALYPWRTIGGEENSAYFPAGTAQYHINADIAWALQQYVHATKDMSILLEGGLEMLLETARLWPDLGHFRADLGGKFSIHQVTGPDEYSCLVDNNYYTNAMAANHLAFALDALAWSEQADSQYVSLLLDNLKVSEEELSLWQKISHNIYLAKDSHSKVSLQDDAFAARPKWKREDTQYPLLLNYHPLVIYRHQVCKQPDVLMAHFMLPDGVGREQKARDYDYYEPLTTHDSSLSPIVHSILACEIGEEDKAYRYFSESARLDLDNLHQNTQHGVHIACMAGTWLGIVQGYAGMKLTKTDVNFSPKKPSAWQSYGFRIRIGDCLLALRVAESCTYTLIEGDTLTFLHADREVCVSKGQALNLPCVEFH